MAWPWPLHKQSGMLDHVTIMADIRSSKLASADTPSRGNLGEIELRCSTWLHPQVALHSAAHQTSKHHPGATAFDPRLGSGKVIELEGPTAHKLAAGIFTDECLEACATLASGVCCCMTDNNRAMLTLHSTPLSEYLCGS